MLVKKKYIKMFFKIAKLVSKQSYCKKRKVGSVIIKNNNIVSIGYNGTLSKLDSNQCEDTNGKTLHEKVFHSEMNAIMSASKRGISLQNTSIFVTTEPCSECSKLIVASGIKEVFIIDKYKHSNGINYLRKCNVKIKYKK